MLILIDWFGVLLCGCVHTVSDAGAVRAIANKTSLFAAGIRGVEGNFASHSNVALYIIPPTAAAAGAADTKQSAKPVASAAAGASVAVGSGSGGGPFSSIESGVELARGLSNYSAAEIRLIMGKASTEFESVLGYLGQDSVIHRDALVLTHPTLIAYYAARHESETSGSASASASGGKKSKAVAVSTTGAADSKSASK